jgi:hypothetical protein
MVSSDPILSPLPISGAASTGTSLIGLPSYLDASVPLHEVGVQHDHHSGLSNRRV